METVTCPHCHNEDATLLELVHFGIKGSGAPGAPAQEKQERWLCVSCSKEFTRQPNPTGYGWGV